MGRAPSAHIIQLHIALPQPRFPELERHLAEISDPFHECYGEHLSKQEVEELVAPHPSSVDSLGCADFLKGDGSSNGPEMIQRH